MNSEPFRVNIEQVPGTGGRWWRASAGSVTIERARDPEHEIARELVALGNVGRMQTYVAGKASMNLSVEIAAKRSISEGASTRLRVVAWRPFDEEADKRSSRQNCTVKPLAANSQGAVVVPASVQRPLHGSTVQQQTIIGA